MTIQEKMEAVRIIRNILNADEEVPLSLPTLAIAQNIVIQLDKVGYTVRKG